MREEYFLLKRAFIEIPAIYYEPQKNCFYHGRIAWSLLDNSLDKKKPIPHEITILRYGYTKQDYDTFSASDLDGVCNMSSYDTIKTVKRYGEPYIQYSVYVCEDSAGCFFTSNVP